MENPENDRFRMPNMSPLFVGFLGVLGGALLVAFCHGIIVLCSDAQHQQEPNRNSTVVNPGREAEDDVVVISRADACRLEHRTAHATAHQSKGSREQVCAVCLGEFRPGEGVRVLRECSHVFHVSCINKWLEIHPNCPLCRASAVRPAAEVNGTPEVGGDVV